MFKVTFDLSSGASKEEIFAAIQEELKAAFEDVESGIDGTVTFTYRSK